MIFYHFYKGKQLQCLSAQGSPLKKFDPLTKERICSQGENSSPKELTPNENEGKKGNKRVVSPKMNPFN